MDITTREPDVAEAKLVIAASNPAAFGRNAGVLFRSSAWGAFVPCSVAELTSWPALVSRRHGTSSNAQFGAAQCLQVVRVNPVLALLREVKPFASIRCMTAAPAVGAVGILPLQEKSPRDDATAVHRPTTFGFGLLRPVL